MAGIADALTHRDPSPLAEDFLGYLLVVLDRGEATIDAYRRDLVVLESFLDAQGTQAVAASSEDIRAFVSWISERLSARSVARTFSAVRGYFRYLVIARVRHDDPIQGVRIAVPFEVLPKALSVEEVVGLLDSVGADGPIDLRDRAMLELLYGSGLRISELIALELDDIEVELGWLTVTGKGRKQRRVPTSQAAQVALDRYVSIGRQRLIAQERRAQSRRVILNARGGPLTRQGAWFVLKGRARAVGLDTRFTPHVLRHSCATHMVEAGADLRVVQELLGHSSVATTEIYTKVSLGHLREVYRETHPLAVGFR